MASICSCYSSTWFLLLLLLSLQTSFGSIVCVQVIYVYLEWINISRHYRTREIAKIPLPLAFIGLNFANQVLPAQFQASNAASQQVLATLSLSVLLVVIDVFVYVVLLVVVVAAAVEQPEACRLKRGVKLASSLSLSLFHTHLSGCQFRCCRTVLLLLNYQIVSIVVGARWNVKSKRASLLVLASLSDVSLWARSPDYSNPKLAWLAWSMARQANGQVE